MRPKAKRDVTVIVSDPPWKFATRSAKGGKKSPKYDTMTIEELRALGPVIRDLAGKHCYHAMWTTAPMLAESLMLLAHWGFEYKTHLVWSKARLGTGYHARSRHEVVLIGTRGQPGVAVGRKIESVFHGAPLEKRHSSKPDVLHRWVDAGFPCATRIELFARKPAAGWITIGGELGSLIRKEGLHCPLDSSIQTDAGATCQHQQSGA